MQPSLNPKTRAVVDSIIVLIEHGKPYQTVFKQIMRAHGITFQQLRKIFADELAIELPNKKECYKRTFVLENITKEDLNNIVKE